MACSNQSQGDNSSFSAYTFKDQPVTGKIGNEAWSYEDGYAEISGKGSNSSIRIELFRAQEGDGKGCEVFISEGNTVFFSVPHAKDIFPLQFDHAGSNNRTITLYEEENPIGINHLAGEGAVEIIAITQTEVLGRIDARSGRESFINGNFKVPICK